MSFDQTKKKSAVETQPAQKTIAIGQKRPASGSPKAGDNYESTKEKSAPAQPVFKKPKMSQRYSPEWDLEKMLPSPADVPPVTIINSAGKAVSTGFLEGKNLTFGNFEGSTNKEIKPYEDNQPSHLEPSPVIATTEKREKRQSKPSQKVLYMQDDPAFTTRKVSNINVENKDITPTKASKLSKGKDSAAERREVDKEIGPHRSQHPSVETNPPHHFLGPAEFNVSRKGSVSSEEEIPLAIGTTTQKKVSTVHESSGSYSKQPNEDENKNRANHQSAQLSSDEDDQMQMYWAGDPNLYTEKSKTSTQGKSKEVKVVTSNAVSDTQPKKSNIPSDPIMKYDACTLESFSSLVKEAQYRGETIDSESSMPLFLNLFDNLKLSPNNKYGARNLRRFYALSSSGGIYNPARANADDAGVLKDSNGSARIVLAGSGSNTLAPSLLFVSNGCIANCNLIQPGTTGSGANMYNIKKVGVWILYEEFDVMTAYFGRVFGKTQFWSHFFGDILTFATQRDGVSAGRQGSSSTNVSPKKPSGLFGHRTPSKSSANRAHTLNNPPFLKFSENVPIYDLRNHDFQITPETIAKLSELPRYQMAISDLKPFAAVTVGYTVNTYPYNQLRDGPSNALSLSFNIQFVIFHGDLDIEKKYEEDEEY